MTDELGRIRALHSAEEPPSHPSAGPTNPTQTMLGGFFNPQPFGYAVMAGVLRDEPCLFLTLESSVGRLSFPLSQAEAQALGRQLIRESSGLVLPT